MYKRIITLTLFLLCLLGGQLTTNATPKGMALCQVVGETAPSFGLTYSYTKSNCTQAVASWTATGGTIISQDELSVNVQWTSTGTGTVNALSGTGSVLASLSVDVGSLDGGYISTTSQSVVSGSNAGTIIAAAASGGNGSFTYQWQKSSASSGPWTDISGSTDKNCDPGSVSAVTYYRRKVSSGGYVAYTTNVAVVNIYPVLSVGGVTPASQYLNPGATGTALSIGSPAGGDGSYSYQWQSSADQSNWNNISGATNSSFTVEGPLGDAQQTTYYRVVVSSAGTSVNSGAVFVTTYGVIHVSDAFPAQQTVNFGTQPGNIKCLTVTGGDGSYSYQWQYYDGSIWQNIAGATTNIYIPDATSPTAQQDVLYRMAVTSNGVTVYSAQAKVTTYGQLGGGSISIASNYINYNTDAGTISSAAGASGGDGNYAYQWYVSSDNTNWQAVSGATNTTYSPGVLTGTTYYKRKVTCASQTAESNTITINVYAALQAGAISGASTINYNTSPGVLSLNGVTGGNGIYSYQWQYTDGTNWLDVAGATGGTYTPAALLANNTYRVSVSSNGVTVYSSGYLITVYPELKTGSITPASASINYGDAAPTISISPTGGSGTYTYQWASSTDGTTWNDINGATGASISAGALTVSTYYRVQVTSNGVTASSSAAYIQVYPLLTAGAVTPATQTINFNTAPATLTGSAASGGNGSYSYQWQYQSGGAWIDIAGATALTYTPGNLTSTTNYRLTYTSNDISVASNSSSVTVYPQLQAGAINPASQSIYYHTKAATLMSDVPTGGDGTYVCLWQSSLDNNTWINISGAGGYGFDPGVLDTTTWYRAIITSNGVSVYSSSVKVAVYPQLQPLSFTQDSVVINYNTSPGAIPVSPASGGNGTITYQWQSSTNGTTWTNLNGVTGLSYTPGNLTLTTYYRVIATNNGTNVTSNVFKVKVYADFNPGSIRVVVTNTYRYVNYNTTCGAIINLNSPTGGDGNYTYQWQRSRDKISWVDLQDANAANYTGTENLTDTAYFRRSVTCNGITRFTNIISIYVYAPFIAGKASPSIIYANYYDYSDTVRVSVPPTGGAPTFTYSWYTSTNGTAWGEKQRGGDYVPQFDRNGYIKCRFASNGVYVESNIIRVLYPVNPGYITTIDSWVKDSTTTLSIISGAAASNGIDTTTTDYNYTYQKSYDQVNWTNLPGAAISNIDKTTFVRRKVQHGFETAYSNVMTVYRLGFTPSYYWPNGAAAPANGTQPVVPMPTYTGITNVENLNYVKTRDFTKPGITDITTADAQAGVYDVRQVTAYFDGLGRPMQTVAQQASPLRKDLVTTNFYDVFGREAQQYLPFVDSVGTDGKFKTDPSSKQPAFYNKLLAGQESYYYTNNVYEASPLNTVLRTTPAGKSWTGRDIGVQQLDRTNTVNDLVRMWNIVNDTSLPVGTQYYPVGKLFLHETLDENGNKTIECKDYAGKVVAKMTHPTIYTNVNVTNWLYTYYVYDALGNLRYVITPKAVTYLNSNSWTLNRAVVDELCFQYRYDGRGRMITKKVPGAGIVNLVYDARDRQVMMQDSLMRSKGQWNVTVYDELNRPLQTGLWNNTTDAVTHRQNAYHSTSYPTLDNNYILLTETFYDDYSWKTRNDINLGARDFTNKFNNTIDLPVIQDNAYSLVPAAATQTRGLVTGIRTKILDTTSTNNYLTAITWYDDHNRPIQVQSQNITAGWDTVTTRYDFAGNVLSTCEAHATAASAADIKWNKLSTAFNYDHGGRALKIVKYLDGNNIPETLSINKYDELARLRSKTLGEQKVDSLINDFNIRGWLKGINSDYVRNPNAANHWFGMNLSYDYGQVRPQLNGNISANEWKTKGDGVVRGYGYLYDNVDRITAAHYGQFNGSNYVVDPVIDFMVDSLAYDANGNILNMRQKGLVVNASPYIDRLGYTYQGTTWTNKLAKVKDNSTVQAKLGDFKDGTNTGDDYAYDGNGNMISDANKNISSIAYNHLNLPQQITVDGKGKITYIYDAAGNKLKKITQDDSTQTKTVTTYIGGYVYKNDTLQFIGQEEGRIRPTKKDQILAYNYDYFIKDHLGNVRMVLTEERQQDVYPVATLETSGLATEKGYYNIDENQIVGKDSLSAFRAAAGSNYPNNNGNPPYNNNPAMGDDVTAESQRLYKLNGANGQKLGLGITLKVMCGDTVSILGKSFFHLDAGQKSNNTAKLLFDNIINSMFGGGGFAGVDKGATAALLNGSTATTTPLTSWLNSQTVPPDSIPKAYINWILLDEQFRPVTQGSGFDAVGSNDVIKSHLRSVTIPKNGYLYVYCSNESNINVFFDNLQVIHSRGPLLEETHYYPYGLTMAGISSKALAFGDPKNKEKTFQGQRFDDDLNLNWVQFKYRNHDPQIGRFLQIDPLAEKYVYNSTYAFSENKVTSHVEMEGLESLTIQDFWRSAGISQSSDPIQFTKNVAKEALKPSNWVYGYGAAGAIVVPFVLVGVMTGGIGEGAVLSAEVSTLPTTMAGDVATAAETTAMSEAPAAVNLADRANEIHSTLSLRTQNATTTAVGSATTAEGNNVTLVASSENKLRKPQISALKPGEIAVEGAGHAEKTILNYASTNGMTVNSVAASRPICAGCATAIQDAGATPASPLKVYPKATSDATYVKPQIVIPPKH